MNKINLILSLTHFLSCYYHIPIRLVDFLFGKMLIYSRRDFSFIFYLIYDDFYGFIKKYRVKTLHFYQI